MKLIGCSFSIFLHVALPILGACLLAWLLCDIEYGHKYHFLAGIWHGIFVVPNFIRHIFDDNVLYIADNSTSAYTISYWIFALSTIATVATRLVAVMKKMK